MGTKESKHKSIRVVADTNVLISAFLWQGTVKEIFVLAKKSIIILCVTKETIAEFQKVLEYEKFTPYLKNLGKAPEDIVDELLEVVEYHPSIELPLPIIKDDPADDKFLACALSVQASCIISGDHHLTDLKTFYDIPIFTPAQFLKKLSAL